jgi:MFS family permease
MPNAHDPYAALRIPDYRRILTVNVLSACGSGMQFLALEWEIYQRTGSKAALGFIGLVQFIPVLLLSIPVGHLADRVSRKKLFVLAQAILALGSAGLFANSYFGGPVVWVYPILTVIGIGRAFGAPARWALLPQVVPLETLSNAVTWNSSGWQVSTVVGPALGGFLIALTGEAWWAFAGAAGGYLVGTVVIATISPRPMAADPKSGASSLDTLLAGLRFVWNTPLILATITLDLFAVLLGGAVALLPVYAKDILHVGATELGWLRAAPSVGALIMALALAHRPPLRRAGPALLLSVAGFGLATIVFGLSENLALSMAMLAITGALDNVSIVVRGTLVQLLTPDPMRGRVTAVNTIFIVTSNELGAFESGMTAELFGPVASVVGGGIGALLVVVWVMIKWPAVLRLGPLNNPTGELYCEAAEAEVLEEQT